MPINESRPTATILQFPVQRRSKAMSPTYANSAAGTHDVSWPVVECGSGWYHEAAMREADRSRRS